MTCSKSTKFKNQPIEKQQELKEKARQYHKNRYHNFMVAVIQSDTKFRVEFRRVLFIRSVRTTFIDIQ